jgi:hypothetical protein
MDRFLVFPEPNQFGNAFLAVGNILDIDVRGKRSAIEAKSQPRQFGAKS